MGELSSYSVLIFFYVYVNCIKVLLINFWCYFAGLSETKEACSPPSVKPVYHAENLG